MFSINKHDCRFNHALELIQNNVLLWTYMSLFDNSYKPIMDMLLTIVSNLHFTFGYNK